MNHLVPPLEVTSRRKYISPDRSPTPDKLRKSTLPNTQSPRIDLQKVNQTKEREKRIVLELIQFKENNKKLKIDNMELKQKLSELQKQYELETKQAKQKYRFYEDKIDKLFVANKKGVSINKESFLQNIEQGKQRKLLFQEISEYSKDKVLKEFNRLMESMKKHFVAKIQDLQARLVLTQQSHKGVCDALTSNKIIQINYISKNQQPTRLNGYIKDQSSNLKKSKTPMKRSNLSKSRQSQRQTQILTSRRQHKQISRKLTYSHVQQRPIFNHEHYQSQIKRLSDTVQQLKQKLYQQSNQKYSSNIKIISDLNQQLQKSTKNLSSNFKTQQNINQLLTNFKTTQQNVQLLRKQNQKLRSQNSKTQKQMHQSRIIKKHIRQTNSKQKQISQISKRYSRRPNKNDYLLTPPTQQRKYSKSPYSNQSFLLNYKDQVSILKNKILNLETQNQGLHILRKRYLVDINNLIEEIRLIEKAIGIFGNSIIKTKKQTNNIIKQVVGKKDGDLTKIQINLCEIVERLKVVQKGMNVNDFYQ